MIYPAILLAMLVTTPRESGCECWWTLRRGDQFMRLDSPPPFGRVELERCRAVFTGRVVALEPSPLNVREDVEAKVEVLRVWKGPSVSQVIPVTTAASPLGCGFPFQVGETYLFFIDEHFATPVVRITRCSRTKAISEAATEIKVLEELFGVSQGK